MPLQTKIALSDKERSFVTSTDWILTKQAIIQKVYTLLAACSTTIRDGMIEKQSLPETVRFSVPKIFKGEHYQQLPYVLLDYPRHFEKADVFVIRTMFWWAHFFSITLQVSGKYKSLVKSADDIKQLPAEGLFVCVNEDQWQHHFGADNYIRVSDISVEALSELFAQRSFIKLAIQFDLSHWDAMPGLLTEGYETIAALMVNSPVDERVLSPGIPITGSDL